MSISIEKEKCIGCGRCVEVCPGNLIRLSDGNKGKKAGIRRVEECWGCTSCIKICPVNAIEFFLGADIGGLGTTMTVTEKGHIYEWVFRHPDGKTEMISVDRRSSNKY